MSEQIEGRNAVMEAFRAGRCVDKLFILDGCQDKTVRSIAREARKHDTIINFVQKNGSTAKRDRRASRESLPGWPFMSTLRWKIF